MTMKTVTIEMSTVTMNIEKATMRTIGDAHNDVKHDEYRGNDDGRNDDVD